MDLCALIFGHSITVSEQNSRLVVICFLSIVEYQTGAILTLRKIWQCMGYHDYIYLSENPQWSICILTFAAIAINANRPRHGEADSVLHINNFMPMGCCSNVVSHTPFPMVMESCLLPSTPCPIQIYIGNIIILLYVIISSHFYIVPT